MLELQKLAEIPATKIRSTELHHISGGKESDNEDLASVERTPSRKKNKHRQLNQGSA